MKQVNHRILASCVVLYALCALALAQVQTTTAITGTVTDSSGAVLPGVEVVVTDQDTGTVRRAITNDAGLYVIQSLKPGTYSISASLTGFKTAVVKDRQVQVTIPAQVNLVMQVGELSETVTVSGVGEEMVNKTTAQLATTINENLVKNLPVETRNYFDLVALAPNTSPEYLSGAMSFGQHSMRRVNAASSFESSGVFAAGERDSSSFVSIDGASPQIANYNQTVTIQSSSTIKELRLETASANAEFGNGSNAVNVITKSGTNDFHGEVFWQHRNDNIDAVGYLHESRGAAASGIQAEQVWSYSRRSDHQEQAALLRELRRIPAAAGGTGKCPGSYGTGTQRRFLADSTVCFTRRSGATQRNL